MTRQRSHAGDSGPSPVGRDAFRRMATGSAGAAVMDAAVLTAPGIPHFSAFEEPIATSNSQVLVDVRVAGLNPVDLLIAAGRFDGAPLRFPSIAGHEGVGTVGTRRVYFSGPATPYGSMAQRTLVAPERIVDVPAGVDDETAAALGTSALAAWLSLTWRARLQQGESVLVLGATGALGMIAVQAARLLGAGRVVAAGRHAAGLRVAAERGADAVVDIGAGGDLAAEFRRAAGGAVDIVIDPVWGSSALAALQATAPFGRLVQIGNSAAPDIPMPAGVLRRSAVSILGYSNLTVPPADRATAYLRMAALAAAGELRVDVEPLPLRDVETAWRRQASSAHRKLVLIP